MIIHFKGLHFTVVILLIINIINKYNCKPTLQNVKFCKPTLQQYCKPTLQQI